MRVTLMFLFCLVLPTIGTLICEKGWKKFRASCYKHFTFVKSLSFHDAQSYCKQNGSHLVDLEDKEETDFVIEVSKNANRTFDWGYSWPWIGLVRHGDVWKWAPSMRNATYMPPWMPTQPQGENCVRLNVDYTVRYETRSGKIVYPQPGQLEDWPCKSLNNRFVCKRKAVEQCTTCVGRNSTG